MLQTTVVLQNTFWQVAYFQAKIRSGFEKSCLHLTAMESIQNRNNRKQYDIIAKAEAETYFFAAALLLM